MNPTEELTNEVSQRIKAAGDHADLAWFEDWKGKGEIEISFVRMIQEVMDAVEKYSVTKTEPSTGHWHDNQCYLFQVLSKPYH